MAEREEAQVVTCTCDMNGTSHLHCRACCRSLLNLTAYDAHQDVNYGRDPAVECLDPASLGMTDGGIGVWGTPEGHARREADTARLAAARAERLARSAEQPPPGVPATPRATHASDGEGGLR